MRVIASYGKGEIDLGYMPVLPDREDRVRFDVPVDLRQGDDPEYLTVGRRMFETRPGPMTIDHQLNDILPRLEWVCILIFQETR